MLPTNPSSTERLLSELERLDGLEKAATPGPWTYLPETPRALIEAGVYSSGIRILGAIAPLKRLAGDKDANVQLTAALRSVAPGLIALVRCLLEEREYVIPSYEQTEATDAAIAAFLEGGR